MRQQNGNRGVEEFQLYSFYRPCGSMAPVFRARGSGKIVSNHPQTCHPQKPRLLSLNFQAIRNKVRSPSTQQRQERRQCLPKISLKSLQNYQNQQLQPQDSNESQVPAQISKQLISRVKMQKRYNYGKAMFRRRSQQQNRKIKQQQQDAIKLSQERNQQELAFGRLVDSIFMHQERISRRVMEGVERSRRAEMRSKSQQLPLLGKQRIVQSPRLFFQDMASSKSIMRFSPKDNH